MTQSIFAHISDATLRKVLVAMRAEGDHAAVRLVQEELFYRQPIMAAPAYIGFTATRGDYDLDDLVGHGNTEAEAVEDLVEKEEDHRSHETAKRVPPFTLAAEHYKPGTGETPHAALTQFIAINRLKPSDLD